MERRKRKEGGKDSYLKQIWLLLFMTLGWSCWVYFTENNYVREIGKTDCSYLASTAKLKCDFLHGHF